MKNERPMTQNETKEKDELTQLITRRLGERQKKLQRMQEMECKSATQRMVLKRGVLAVAACLVVAMLLFPWGRTENPVDALGIDLTPTETFRSATPQSRAIAQMIDDGKLEEARTELEEALEESDDIISKIRSYYDYDEEAEYMEQMEMMSNAELRWLYACVLTKTEHYKEAMKELKRYMRKKEFCDHEKEAQELLEEIKKLKK